MKDLLLIVDAQNVYKKGEPWGCPTARRAVTNIRRLLDSSKTEQIIFTRFDAPANPRGTWKVYNKEYSAINENFYLNEIIAELKPYTERYPVYSKSSYSSCAIKEVREAALAADRILLTGVVAECCILSTMTGLIDLGVKVLYVTDAIAGQTADFEEMIRKIAESYSTLHTELITTEEYCKIL